MEKHFKQLDLSNKRFLYAVGDIQGAFDLLENRLKEIGFDFEQDALVAVGDLVDRGRYSHQVLEYLRKKWFYSVKGNHEDFLVLGAFDSYYAHQHKRNGGEWFYKYDEDSRAIFASELERLPVALEVLWNGKKYGFVHADVQGNDWDVFTSNLTHYSDSFAHEGTVLNHALWSRSRIKDWFTGFDDVNHTPISGIDQVYVGHSIFEHPFAVHNINYIDTGAYVTHNITVHRVDVELPQINSFHPVYSTNGFWEH